ncbi:hypothetical protein HF086_000128 [Spodoptera exigua]|uniref:Uncharacterized protein n=1 Tax=Spodoptera exigua TaxID=7107 RepID=A0A922SB95_SPOEX|nr:hypothetical protein HF086_000128 [Spodoptera exigua]
MAKPKKQTREERLRKKRLAEKKRYENVKNNAEKQEKNRKSYIRRKEQKKQLPINEMLPREQRLQKKRWRTNFKTYYLKKKQEKRTAALLEQNTPPQSPNILTDAELIGIKNPIHESPLHDQSINRELESPVPGPSRITRSNSEQSCSYSAFCKMKPFWVVLPDIRPLDTCLCKLYNVSEKDLLFPQKVKAFSGCMKMHQTVWNLESPVIAVLKLSCVDPECLYKAICCNHMNHLGFYRFEEVPHILPITPLANSTRQLREIGKSFWTMSNKTNENQDISGSSNKTANKEGSNLSEIDKIRNCSHSKSKLGIHNIQDAIGKESTVMKKMKLKEKGSIEQIDLLNLQEMHSIIFRR